MNQQASNNILFEKPVLHLELYRKSIKPYVAKHLCKSDDEVLGYYSIAVEERRIFDHITDKIRIEEIVFLPAYLLDAAAKLGEIYSFYVRHIETHTALKLMGKDTLSVVSKLLFTWITCNAGKVIFHKDIFQNKVYQIQVRPFWEQIDGMTTDESIVQISNFIMELNELKTKYKSYGQEVPAPILNQIEHAKDMLEYVRNVSEATTNRTTSQQHDVPEEEDIKDYGFVSKFEPYTTEDIWNHFYIFFVTQRMMSEDTFREWLKAAFEDKEPLSEKIKLIGSPIATVIAGHLYDFSEIYRLNKRLKDDYINLISDYIEGYKHETIRRGMRSSNSQISTINRIKSSSEKTE